MIMEKLLDLGLYGKLCELLRARNATKTQF